MTQNRTRTRNSSRQANQRTVRAAPRISSVVSCSPQSAWIGPPQRSRARRAFRARLLLAGPVLFVAAGIVLAIVTVVAAGIVVALIGVVVLVGDLFVAAPARVVASIASRSADPVQEAGLANLVEGLCIANGLTLPELRVIEDDAANLILLGQSSDATTLFCTTGLLAQMDRIELEGLIAHELAHERRDEVGVGTLSMLAVGLFALVSARAARLVLLLAGPERQSLADQTAVAMTRYPPGLLEALDKLRETKVAPKLSTTVTRLTSGLWCAPLPESSGPARPGELDLSDRVAALAEL